MIGIYKITSPSGNIYIGQSTNISSRKSVYKRLACIGQSRLLSSLKKYGWDNHTFEVLIECSVSELNSYEIFFIREHNCIHPNGLNLKSGGFGNGGHNQETKLKISATKRAMKIKPFFSVEHRMKLKEARSKKVYTDEYRRNLSIAQLGKKQKLSSILKRSKAVIQMDEHGCVIGEFFGMGEASKITGIYRSNISRSCKTHLAAGGYYWKLKHNTHAAN